MSLLNIAVAAGALLFPWAATILAQKSSFFNKLGPIVICYLFGLLLGNLEIPYDQNILKTMADIVVPLAIPLFIFGVDFISWFKNSGKTVLSFGLVIFSVFVTTLVTGFLFHPYVEGASKISGMLAGVYTGGTPNLSAIGKALEVSEETIILVNGVDMAAGGLYLAVLLFFGKNFLSSFLSVEKVSQDEKIEVSSESVSDFKQNIKGSFIGAVLSIILIGASYLINMALMDSLSVAFFIFLLSFFSGALSFKKPVRELKGTYELGHYLLMVFCVAIGGLANIKRMLSLSADVAAMCFMVVFGAIFLHLILAKIFKVDRDTAIITSVAGIYGPPFVPLIADRFENKKMIAPGIATGLVGFALGNYLGLVIYYILNSLLG